VRIETGIKNFNRTVGTMLSGRVAERYGYDGLPDDSIHIKARGIGGQSFGAWLAHGVTIELEGEANDYVGKGLSGGRIIIYPPLDSSIDKAETTSSSATPCSTAPSAARSTSAASPASASACATPAPARWSKASATMAAST
jgi:hypothetical protein